MSGHSKWSKIKRAKEAADKQKGKVFSKLSKEISIAARNEADPDKNAALRDAIARAKEANMPQANIEKILKSKQDAETQQMVYEGFGPGGAALLITTETDNTNRTVSDIRTLLKKYGGNLGEPGSVQWKFTERVVATLPLPNDAPQEQLELELIDAGAEDIAYDSTQQTIYAAPERQQDIEHVLQNNKIQPNDVRVTYVPIQKLSASDPEQEILKKLIDELQEMDDIMDIYTDIEQ